MSPAEPAQPVGDAPCPIEGCSETVKLYRYREQSSRGSMFKGKFYARCSRHGRVIEASSSSTQDHVINNGNIWDRDGVPAAPAQELTLPTPEPQKATGSQSQQEPASELKKRPFLEGWNLWDW